MIYVLAYLTIGCLFSGMLWARESALAETTWARVVISIIFWFPLALLALGGKIGDRFE